MVDRSRAADGNVGQLIIISWELRTSDNDSAVPIRWLNSNKTTWI